MFDGHLHVIQLIIGSFQEIPIGSDFIKNEPLEHLSELTGWMFTNALSISLPAITGLTMVNLMFGIMTKASPQLNVFAISFPITMVLGLIMMYLTLADMKTHVHRVLEEGFLKIHAVFMPNVGS